MNSFCDLRGQQSEGAAEGAVIGDEVGVVVGKTAINQVAAQFPLQIAVAPALQVFHNRAAQQTVGGDAWAPGAGGGGGACGQTLADQVQQLGILQQRVERVEPIVLEADGLGGQRGIEEPGLVGGRGDHIIPYPIISSTI